MGSLTNLLLRTLLDVSVSISNAVVKLHARQTAAILMSKRIHIITAAGDWLSDLEVSPPTLVVCLLSCQRMTDSKAEISCERSAYDFCSLQGRTVALMLCRSPGSG